MKFSVIVPVYNVEKYLDKCVNSILSQTYTDFELILVDDGSPDNCPKMCDEWAKKDSRIIVIHKENGGVSAARNDGIVRASGDYLLFVDSDDYINKDLLKVCYENLLNQDLDILSFNYAFVDTENVVYPTKNLSVGEWTLNSNQEKFDYYKSIITPYGGWAMWTRCFKTSLVKNNGISFPVGYKYAEDFVFVSKCILKSIKVKQIDFVGYYYVGRENSTTHSIKRVPFSEISYMLCLVYDFALKEGYDAVVKGFYTIYDILMGVLVFNYTNYISLKNIKQDLQYINLIGFKDYNDKIVSEYLKNRNTKDYLELSRLEYVKRMYQDAIYKYSYKKSMLAIYLTAFKIKINLFIQKIKVKFKKICNKG